MILILFQKILIFFCFAFLFLFYNFRGQEPLRETLHVTVSNRNVDKSRRTVTKPTIPCSQYNVTLLWRSRKATGYFYEGKWNLRNCLGNYGHIYIYIY